MSYCSTASVADPSCADLPLGGADASLVVLAERRSVRRIATLDQRHFSVVRPADGSAFELLPG